MYQILFFIFFFYNVEGKVNLIDQGQNYKLHVHFYCGKSPGLYNVSANLIKLTGDNNKKTFLELSVEIKELFFSASGVEGHKSMSYCTSLEIKNAPI